MLNEKGRSSVHVNEISSASFNKKKKLKRAQEQTKRALGRKKMCIRAKKRAFGLKKRALGEIFHNSTFQNVHLEVNFM